MLLCQVNDCKRGDSKIIKYGTENKVFCSRFKAQNTLKTLGSLRSSAGNETQEIFSERITNAYAHTKISIYKYIQKPI